MLISKPKTIPTVFYYFLLMGWTCALPVMGYAQPTSSTAPFWQNTIEQKKLWLDKGWLRLLHYQKNLWGGWESEVDGANFFLDPKGKSSPEHEMKATLSALLGSANDEDSSPACRFPARLIWLQSKLGIALTNSTNASCPSYLKFKNLLNPVGISLVFSSYYINDPSTTFGHTLLRFHARENHQNGKNQELLDFGINFAAQVEPGTNPIHYGLGGLSGMFPGVFSNIPYYYKIREYHNYHQRDLWSYDLNLDQSQLEFLVAHIWELGSTYFDYFFFTENCAYHILSLLEDVDVHLELKARTPYYVIPGDTVRIIYETPNLVKKIDFRPSVQRIFMNQYDKLSEREQMEFRQLIESRAQPALSEFPISSQIKILDTLIAYFSFKYPKQFVQKEVEIDQWRNQTLIARAKIRRASETQPVATPKDEEPHRGHKSGRASAFVGSHPNTFSPFYDLEYRFALHDKLDFKLGYPQSADIEFMNLRLRYDNDQIFLDRVGIVEVNSFQPWSQFNHELANLGRIELQALPQEICQTCYVLSGVFARGISWQRGGVLMFMLLGGEVRLSSFYSSTYRLGLGPHIGMVGRLGPWSFEISGQSYIFNGETETSNSLVNFELRHQSAGNGQWTLQIQQKTQPELRIGYRFYH